MELYLGYPIFLWEGFINFSSVIVAGLIIAFVTTFYLKKKDEKTRVAGVPYDPHIQYADIFTSVKKYRAFFKEFEELFSKHKLWLDFKVRHKMLLMQGYFAIINASLVAFNRIPLPAGIVLKPKEMDDLNTKLLLILGVALDEEFNTLLMDLEVLMVNSIYKLDLNRPKNSFLSKVKENKEMKEAEKFLVKESLMGKYLPYIAVMAFEMVAEIKDLDLSEKETFEYFEKFSK
jgi:hypothetical protein